MSDLWQLGALGLAVRINAGEVSSRKVLEAILSEPTP